MVVKQKSKKIEEAAAEEIQQAYVDFLKEIQKLKKLQLKVLTDFERRLAKKSSEKILKKIDNMLYE